ncbi:MAG: DUF350 domain-containing protein [Gemmatimonadetes bacterium]|nr:DUF350 domain-containing protein [Gemmatimonadota bacterium]
MDTLLKNVVASSVYAVLGIVILFVAFWVVDRLTPGHLWNEILKDKNSAIAILMGCLGIGISIIIAASIH